VIRNLLFAAGLVAVLVASPVAATAHTFAEQRTVVAQVERDQLVVVVGYQPAAGAESLAAVGQASVRPKGTKSQALRAILAARAVSPLTVSIDGTAVEPTSMRTKVFVDPPGSDRLAVAILLIYDLPAHEIALEVGIADASTEFSWVDRTSCQRTITTAWPARSWVTGVASFLLTVAAPDPGAEPCASSSPPPPSSDSPPATASSTTNPRPTASRRSSASRRRSEARSSATSPTSSSPAR
jgi:hypothetical protein